MLERNIDVASDLVALRDRVDEFVTPMGWVRIQQANPEVAIDLLNFAEKGSQCGAVCRIHWLTGAGLHCPKIHSVIRRVLTNQIDLTNAFADEPANFRQHRLRRAAAVFPAHLRNHAKSARMIAAFGNLYVGRVRGCKPEARRIVIGNVSWALICKSEAGITAIRIKIDRWRFS